VAKIYHDVFAEGPTRPRLSASTTEGRKKINQVVSP
jgi:hypothetical protein